MPETTAQERLDALLRLIGDPATCPCGASILWVHTRKGKRHPLNLDGSTHFWPCPRAEEFRRRRARR